MSICFSVFSQYKDFSAYNTEPGRKNGVPTFRKGISKRRDGYVCADESRGEHSLAEKKTQPVVCQAKLGCFWHGESPCRARPNQPPLLSVARALVTVFVKCTQRTMQAVGGTVTPKVIQPRYVFLQQRRKKSRRRHGHGHGSQNKRVVIGEIREGLSGSKSMARIERSSRNLGGPVAPLSR